MTEIELNIWHRFSDVFWEYFSNHPNHQNKRIDLRDVERRRAEDIATICIGDDLKASFRDSEFVGDFSYELFSIESDFVRDIYGELIYFPGIGLEEVPLSFYQRASSPIDNLLSQERKSRVSDEVKLGIFFDTAFWIRNINKRDISKDGVYKYHLMIRGHKDAFICDKPVIMEVESELFAYYDKFRQEENRNSEYGILYLPRQPKLLGALELRIQQSDS